MFKQYADRYDDIIIVTHSKFYYIIMTQEHVIDSF